MRSQARGNWPLLFSQESAICGSVEVGAATPILCSRQCTLLASLLLPATPLSDGQQQGHGTFPYLRSPIDAGSQLLSWTAPVAVVFLPCPHFNATAFAKDFWKSTFGEALRILL
ncbi:Hypothetical predicted protein [Podarcis lilfordi]|uniref:Uncharacterized protein n=1 Tax=Podarcis lilfordi TaxID=74358 RepID=A0AA35L3E3_9SAUR|nr:Hypothetical predicted protein [Podarcis lilfordi]